MPSFATLSILKNWLDITTPTDDVLLTNLINQMSVAILEYIQRPDLVKTTYTELQNGAGNQRLTLRNWPVISVTSLIAGQTTIQASTSFGRTGYTLTQWDGTSSGVAQEITLNGYCFPRGWNNVQIIYKAGYCIQNEAQTITRAGMTGNFVYSVIANQRYGAWAQDDGVTYASTGIALTPVTSSPASGQYVVDTQGVYTFNVADNATAILINYSYIPAPLTQACMEWVGERYRYKERIGQTTKSLSGAMTAGYSLAMPDHIKMMLDPYRKFLPL